MPGFYFDTSALVAHYHVEAGTAVVDAILSQVGERVVTSRLGYLETHSAFAMKVRSGELSQEGCLTVRRLVIRDV